MPQSTTQPTDDELLLLGNQLCFAAYSTAHAFNRLYKPLVDALGLTYPQYLVMLTLWETDDRSVKEIGERLLLDSGTLTPLLKRLEAGGLVRRTRDRADERIVRITLTDEGRALRERAKAVPHRVGQAVGMPLEGLGALRDQLLALRDRLNAAAGEE